MKKQLIALGAFLVFALGALPSSAACPCQSHSYSFRTTGPCCPAPMATPCCPAAPCCNDSMLMEFCPAAKPCCPAPCIEACPCPAAPVQAPCATTNDDCSD